MSNELPSNPPIPLKDAIAQASYWREYCKKLVEPDDLPVIKAFFVPLDDLMEVVDLAQKHIGKDIAGMRLYFRLEKSTDTLADIKGMIVPVVYGPDETLLDLVSRDKESAGDDDPSLVFDFTKPCPRECDIISPLFGS